MLIRGDDWGVDLTPKCEKGLTGVAFGEAPGLGFEDVGLESAGEGFEDAFVLSDGVAGWLEAPPPNFASRLLRI